METFYELYEPLAMKWPLSLELRHVREIGRYRLTVLGRGMSHRGGDMVIITTESTSWQQTFKEATEKLRSRITDLQRIGEENAKNIANSSISDGTDWIGWNGGSD